MTLRRPRALGGAAAWSAPTAAGVWNLVSSSPSEVPGTRIIAMSTRMPSRALSRSTEGPSIGASPWSSIPSSTKNAFAASRSSTTTLTWSIRWIAMRVLPLVARPGRPLPGERGRPRILDTAAVRFSGGAGGVRPQQATQRPGRGLTGPVGPDRAGRRTVADQVQPRLPGDGGAVHADPAARSAKPQRREVGDRGTEAGGPENDVGADESP